LLADEQVGTVRQFVIGVQLVQTISAFGVQALATNLPEEQEEQPEQLL